MLLWLICAPANPCTCSCSVLLPRESWMTKVT